jgi:predicted nucleic acid-binding protein
VRATAHRVGDSLPHALVVDSSFLAAVINQRDAHHSRAWVLYERMVAEGTTVAICHPVLRIEFNSIFRTWSAGLQRRQVERLVELAEERLRGGQRALFAGAITPGDPVAKRRFLFRYGHLLVDQTLATLTVARIRLTNELLDRSVDEAVAGPLNSIDALHAAVARLLGEQLGVPPTIATFDGDFERLDGFHIWAR